MNKDRIKFANDLEDRTKQFSSSIYRLNRLLPSDFDTVSLKNQLFRSASSIGANYREANRARSYADFRNKIKLCEAEASETQYWLDIVDELKLIDQKYLQPCQNESSELLAIFTSITKGLKSS